jgi:presenilin-like A22 family membrane protease
LYSSYLPLGVPNWTVIYINTVPQQATIFWRRCQGKRRLLQGEFRTHILYFVFVLLYFIFAYIVVSKIQKKLFPTIVVIFVGLLLSCFIMLSING